MWISCYAFCSSLLEGIILRRMWPSLICHLWEEFSNVHLLWQFDHPEVTLCGWRDVKIQSLTKWLKDISAGHAFSLWSVHYTVLFVSDLLAKMTCQYLFILKKRPCLQGQNLCHKQTKEECVRCVCFIVYTMHLHIFVNSLKKLAFSKQVCSKRSQDKQQWTLGILFYNGILILYELFKLCFEGGR